MVLEEFNAASEIDLVDAMRRCLDIDRWREEIVGARPYRSREQLLEKARRAAAPFSPDEIAGALAHHPRIGDRVTGGDAESSLSRSEQAPLGAADRSVTDAIRAGNRAYEARFGRVFLIRAAGRSAKEILEALQVRLRHSADEEAPIVEQQLREIAVLRLEGMVGE